MLSEYLVKKSGLANFELVGGALYQFLVVVFNNKGLVFVWKRPAANAAVKFASATLATLCVVALLTEWLPITQIVASISGPWNFMVWTELYIWLLLSARCTLMTILLFEFMPVRIIELFSRLALLANLQALQLIPVPLFPYRGKTFFSLQLPHSTENVFIGRLIGFRAVRIDSGTNIFFRQDWSGNSVVCRPKSFQYNRVIELIGWAWRNKPSLSLCEPFFSSCFRLMGDFPRRQQKPFTGAGFSHLSEAI